MINIYEPEVGLPIDLSKSAQRLLQVRPEYLQSRLDEKSSGLAKGISAGTPGGSAVGDIKLGIRDKKLWNKQFKLRLTSCETRRMLDINLKFKTDHLTLDDCQPAETNKNNNLNRGLDIPETIPVPSTKRPPGSPTKGAKGTASGTSAMGTTSGASTKGAGSSLNSSDNIKSDSNGY